jgi:hypothetical protein
MILMNKKIRKLLLGLLRVTTLIALACCAASIAKELPPFWESVLTASWTDLGNETATRG